MNPQKQRDIDVLIQQGYRLDVTGSIQRGWQIINQNLGSFIGFTLLIILLAFASICLCFIPFLFAGNLVAGYYIVSMRIVKQQPVTFSHFFDGFRNSNFPQILLGTLVIGAISSIASIPLYAAQFFVNVNETLINDPKFLTIFGLLALFSWCAAIYISIIYIFAIPLIVDQRIEFWPAMELSRKIASKQWSSFLGLFALLYVLNFVGLLLCGLGLLVTSPLWFSSIVAAYDRVVGLDGQPGGGQPGVALS
jgi:uncharacterized membrane protein